MKPFFLDDAGNVRVLRYAALEVEARAWLGTPFVPHSQIKGAGVDCVHLAAALYQAAGAMGNFRPPAYSMDAGNHRGSSQVLEWLDNHPSFLRVHYHVLDDIGNRGEIDMSPILLRPGDALCFRFGRSEHHVGVLLATNRIIHAPFRRPVEIVSMTDPVYHRALKAAYRPILNPGVSA